MHEVSGPVPRVPKKTSVADIKLYAQQKPADDFTSPANAINARGIKIKIRDLENMDEASELRPYVKASMTNYDVGVQSQKNIVVPSFGTTSALFIRHLGTLKQLKRRVDLLKQSYYKQMDAQRCWHQIDTIIDVMDSALVYLDTQDHKIAAIEEESVYDDKSLAADEKQFNAIMKAKDRRNTLKQTRQDTVGLNKQKTTSTGDKQDPVTSPRSGDDSSELES